MVEELVNMARLNTLRLSRSFRLPLRLKVIRSYLVVRMVPSLACSPGPR